MILTRVEPQRSGLQQLGWRLAAAAILLSVSQIDVCVADGLTPAQLQALLAAGNGSPSTTTDTIARQIATTASNVALTAVQANGGDASHTVLTATGTTSPRTASDRAADIVNVMDFGAKGDDNTDDTASINAALAYARTRTLGAGQQYVGVTGPYARVVFPGGHRFRINSTLNFTGFLRGLIVDMGGAQIDCHTTSDVCIDALSSSFITWNNLTLVGDSSDMPRLGLQMGRTTKTLDTQSVHVMFNDPMITGQFIFTAFYNYSGETMTMLHPSIDNYSGLTGSYAMVEDGYNHFNLSSHFQTVTSSPDVWNSFNEDTVIEGDIRANVGNGIPFWIGGPSRLTFINTYAAAGSPTCTTCYGMVLYNTGGTNTVQLHADINFETTYMTDVFFFTGDSTLSMNGLWFRDPMAGATNSLFKLDSNMTSIQLIDAHVETNGYQPGAKLFDNPAPWRFFGDYVAPSLAGWTPPAYGQILMTIGGQEQLATYGGAPTTAQIADSTNTGGNVRGNYAVDLQSLRTTPFEVASGLYSSVPGGAYNTASGEGSFAAGEGSTAAGRDAIALGSSNASGFGTLAVGLSSTATGVVSDVFGAQGDDHGNNATLALSDAQFTRSGDAQVARHILSGTGSGATAFRLTTGAAPVVPASCLSLPTNFSYAMTIHLHARDFTTPGTEYDWFIPQAVLTKGTSAATTTYTPGPTAPSIVSNGIVTGAMVSASADATNGCLNLSFTPPTANTTDVWHAVARIESIEIQ